MDELAKFIPINAQEHDNELRALIIAKMGAGNGNPTQWVVDVVHEAFQKGFGLGFQTGLMAEPAPPPKYQVAMPPGVRPRAAATAQFNERVRDLLVPPDEQPHRGTRPTPYPPPAPPLRLETGQLPMAERIDEDDGSTD